MTHSTVDYKNASLENHLLINLQKPYGVSWSENFILYIFHYTRCLSNYDIDLIELIEFNEELT